MAIWYFVAKIIVVTHTSGLPGGYRSYDGYFNYDGYGGYWWSSTQYDTDNAWSRALFYNASNVYRFSNNKDFGFSVRCLRD